MSLAARQPVRYAAVPCLVVIEVSDVLFAFDSVPAVIAVSREPLIVYGDAVRHSWPSHAVFVLEALKRYVVHLEGRGRLASSSQRSWA